MYKSAFRFVLMLHSHLNFCPPATALNLKLDHCCFTEDNSTELSCNVTVVDLDTSTVGAETNLSLKLEPTNHNPCLHPEFVVNDNRNPWRR